MTGSFLLIQRLAPMAIEKVGSNESHGALRG